MKIGLFGFLILCVVSCENLNENKMKVIYAKQLEWDFVRTPYTTFGGVVVNGKEKREVYIITNPTNSKKEILDLIYENEKRYPINKEKIEKEQYLHFYRCYYKESKATPLDFKEDPGGFATNVLEDHSDDFIYSIEMVRKVQIDGTITIEWKNLCEE